jgi:hypothetical protein
MSVAGLLYGLNDIVWMPVLDERGGTKAYPSDVGPNPP